MADGFERHSANKLRSIGFDPVHKRGSTFTHRDRRMTLSAYVGELFKMAGRGANMKEVGALIRGIIAMDSQLRWECVGSVPAYVLIISLGHAPLLASQPRIANPSAGATHAPMLTPAAAKSGSPEGSKTGIYV